MAFSDSLLRSVGSVLPTLAGGYGGALTGGTRVPLALMLDERGRLLPDLYFQNSSPISEQDYINTLNYGHPGQGTVLEQRIGIGPDEFKARQARQQGLSADAGQFQKMQLMQQLLARLQGFGQTQPAQRRQVSPISIEGISMNSLDPISRMIRM